MHMEHAGHADHMRPTPTGPGASAGGADAALEQCALCGMPITDAAVTRTIDGIECRFDTEDCARLYQVAAEQGMLDAALAERPEHRHRFIHDFLTHHATAYFTLDGMWCAACASVAEKVLLRVEGVDDAQVSFAAAKGRVDYDSEVVDIDSLVQRIEKLGYKVTLSSTAAEMEHGMMEEHMLIQVLVAFAFGMQVMVLYLVRLYPAYRTGDYSQQVRMVQYLVWLLTTPVLFYGGLSFLRGARQELLARIPGMDTLVALGTLTAYSYSAWASLVGSHATYFDSVAMITQFVMVGRYLEMAGGARARKDVRGLMELQPTRAWLRAADGSLEEVPSARLKVTDRIVVKPGERVPVDAQVFEGEAHADEALLTGESAPVAKARGDTVWAGTLMVDGSVSATVVHDVSTSRLAGIRSLVAHTLETKAPAERMADRAAAALTMVVIAIAVLAGLGWAMTGHSSSEALITAVAVLVVACPCALGLATPLAVSIALGGTARGGVLVRNSAAFETAGGVTDVVLDKTGTVTMARLEVTAVRASDETAGALHDSADLLCLAAAAEQFSEHPLARAIVSACPDVPAPARAFRSQVGAGASVVLERDDSTVTVGRLDLMPAQPAPAMLSDAAARTSQGETVVWVAHDHEIAGFIALRDEIDPTAAGAIDRLRAREAEPVLLSGDSEETTNAVAGELGIGRFGSRLTPEMKADYIEGLQDEGRHVAMIGDGVNDAPALAKADLSITVAGGSDVAGETSDIVLARRDLGLVPWLLAVSSETRSIIRGNLGWAFGYNLIAVPLAAFGLITPGIAAAAMATSSLLVVGNSLRLRRRIPRLQRT